MISNPSISSVLVIVTDTKGSVPRRVGARMVVFPDGSISGTIGGGKFESLVIEAALEALREGTPRSRTWPLHEHSDESFGAICGGEVTVYIEPRHDAKRLFIVGAGHCGEAIAKLGDMLGYAVTVIDDREIGRFAPMIACVRDVEAPDVFAGIEWRNSDAVVLVSRNFVIDRDALSAVLAAGHAGYIGMIGSRKKVNTVFRELEEEGVTKADLERVCAPIGLPIGAETPTEIAVSVMAEILSHTKG